MEQTAGGVRTRPTDGPLESTADLPHRIATQRAMPACRRTVERRSPFRTAIPSPQTRGTDGDRPCTPRYAPAGGFSTLSIAHRSRTSRPACFAPRAMGEGNHSRAGRPRTAPSRKRFTARDPSTADITPAALAKRAASSAPRSALFARGAFGVRYGCARKRHRARSARLGARRLYGAGTRGTMTRASRSGSVWRSGHAQQRCLKPNDKSGPRQIVRVNTKEIRRTSR